MSSKALIVKNGELFAPEKRGVQNILCIGSRIFSIGEIDEDALKRLNFELEVIDAGGAYVIPGLIDPHQHILGGSGEKGFSSQSPEILVSEQIAGGITTVVGCIGVDTYTRTLPALLARAKFFNEEGITAYIYSGGYDVPPRTLTGNIRTDLILVPEVIGTGEVAISDLRSCQPSVHELAKIVADGYVGGLLSKKAGVTHFHVGGEKGGLAPLFDLLKNFDVKPSSLYPTHVERNEKLMKEAITLSHEGVCCDLDTEEQDLPKWMKLILESGAKLERFTVSSDASFSAPATLFDQLKCTHLELKIPLEQLLCFFTSNTAKILKLPHKGKIEPGADADLNVIDKSDFKLRSVIALGKSFMKDGKITYKPTAMKSSNRRIELYGEEKGYASR